MIAIHVIEISNQKESFWKSTQRQSQNCKIRQLSASNSLKCSFHSGERLPQDVVDRSQLPTVPLLKKELADKAVLLRHVKKFPTVLLVWPTKQQLFAVMPLVEVIPLPSRVSNIAHIDPMLESVFVSLFSLLLAKILWQLESNMSITILYNEMPCN